MNDDKKLNQEIENFRDYQMMNDVELLIQKLEQSKVGTENTKFRNW